jgi:hypothetical protein
MQVNEIGRHGYRRLYRSVSAKAAANMRKSHAHGLSRLLFLVQQVSNSYILLHIQFWRMSNLYG